MLSLITSLPKRWTTPITVTRSVTVKSEVITEMVAIEKKQVFHIRLFKKNNQDAIRSQIVENIAAHFANFFDEQQHKAIQSTRQQKHWCQHKSCPDLVIYTEQVQKSGCVKLVPVLAIQIVDETGHSWAIAKEKRHYQAMPHLQEYLLIAKDQFSVKSFYKSKQNNWLLNANVRHLQVPFYINALSTKQKILSITLEDIYAEVIGQLT